MSHEGERREQASGKMGIPDKYSLSNPKVQERKETYAETYGL